MLEKTFFMLKPDAVARGLKEEILSRVKGQGFRVLESKKIEITPELASELYKVHIGKPFFDGLIQFITSGPVIVNLIESENAILKLREIMGATDPRKAEAKTIRGDLKEENVLTSSGTIKNLVHGSDSKESFEYESSIFF